MKYLIIICVFSSMLFADLGKYQVSTTTATSKKGTVYVIETTIDTETGRIIKRKKIHLSKYKLPYKDKRGKLITED